jgi:hypothetical protein
MGWAWHLFNGRFTTFEGRKISVPSDFWVHRSDDGALLITRLAADIPLGHSPSGDIVIHRPRTGPRPDLSSDLDQVAGFLVSSQESIGYRLQFVRKVSMGSGFGYCWEFMRSDLRALSVFCRFDKDTLAVEFDGSPEYREKFYSVLTDVSNVPPTDAR